MIRIAIASHKNYKVSRDPLYIPVMAGSALRGGLPESFARDDIGDNISRRNPAYSELTVLYWMWKNPESFCPDADHVGLCHYRRYFAVRKGLRRRMLTEEEAEGLTGGGRAVLPTPRSYVIETNYSQYAHAHHAEDLDITREIIRERHPGFIPAFDRRMAMTKGHRFNMFIMPRELADEYCAWLFDILFELEKRLDYSGYRGRDRRVLGLVAERLLDVWIDYKEVEHTDIPYIMTERERLVLKGAGLVCRKLRSGASELIKKKISLRRRRRNDERK